MRRVGMRDLSRYTRRIVEEVRNRQEPVDITLHGQVLARLIPPPRAVTPEETRQALQGLREARDRITEAATITTDSSTLMGEERE
jgi:antitoxin (DNA-binding transcriptional repressor) of toxin-antitoxin stability system